MNYILMKDLKRIINCFSDDLIVKLPYNDNKHINEIEIISEKSSFLKN